ncbi:MAG: hypothetical protein NC081_09275 [Roseburia sp.]|nr:hypothetical protein [Roseburia sp.]
MDTFMEKLAHRLSAQEMIKANTAAEAEELNQLKKQVRDYHECLNQMQNLVNEGTEQIRGLKNEETAGYQKLQEELELLFDAVDAAGEKASRQSLQAIEELKRLVDEKMGSVVQEDADAVAKGDDWQQEYGLLFDAVDAAGEKTSQQNIQAIESLRQFIGEKLEEIKHAENGEEDAKRQEELGMLFGAMDAAGEKTSQQNIQAIESLKQFISEKLEEIGQKEDEEEEKRLEEELGRLFSAVNASGERTVRQNSQEIEELKQFIGEKVEDAGKSQENLEQLKRFIEAKLKSLQEDKEASRQLEETITGKMDESQEKVHKECVKVYRNVQAAMSEEFEKQNNESDSRISQLKQRLQMVTIIAGVSAGAAVISLIIQVISCLHII